jgi:hypothetical protein
VANNPYLNLLKALRQNGIDVIVAGGIAAALYGNERVTFDLDLISPLDSGSLRKAFTLLQREGFVFRLPISMEQASDPALLKEWVEDRNLIELTLIRPSDGLEVGFLVNLGDRFADLNSRAEEIVIEGGGVRVLSIRDLIALKAEAGREKDRDDIRYLEKLIAEQGK